MTKVKSVAPVALTIAEYSNILAMLNSKDVESVVMGLTIIENCDRNHSLSTILALKKEGKNAIDSWKEHAPKTFDYLKKMGANPEKPMTWKTMLDLLVEKEVSVEELDFYRKKFEDHIQTHIKDMGYDFIDSIKVELKIKGK